MIRRNNILFIITTLILGLWFNELFFDKSLGISHPIFIVTIFLAFFWLHKKIINFKSGIAWFFLVVIFALSSTFALFDNSILRTINLLIIPILFATTTILFTENNRRQWFDIQFIFELFPRFFAKTLENVVNPFKIVLHPYIGKHQTKWDILKKIILGIVIAIPLLVVIFSLLASADQVFKQYLGNFPDLLKQANWKMLTQQFVLVIFITSVLAGFFWSLLHNNDKEKQPLLIAKRKYDPIIAITVLTLINLVYLFFIIIQFSYLFGGGDLAFLKDFTYAEYAHKGFGELIIITLINLSISIGVIQTTKHDHFAANLLTKLVTTILVIATTIILYSAYFRLSLYEDAYGYTYLRIFVQAFMILLFFYFLGTLSKIWRPKISLMKFYIITGLSALTLVNFVNIDSLIAKKNIDRFEKTGKIDLRYLQLLSNDTTPIIVEFALKSDKLKEYDCDFSEILLHDYHLCFNFSNEDKPNYYHLYVKFFDFTTNWQSWNYSLKKAKNALEAL